MCTQPSPAKKYIWQFDFFLSFRQIQFVIWTNTFCHLDKYIWSFGQIQGFVAEEVGRECTCAHPGEGEPTGGELETALETALEIALGAALEIAPETALEIALEIACLLGV